MMSSATYFKLYGCIYGVYYNKLDKKYNVERLTTWKMQMLLWN